MKYDFPPKVREKIIERDKGRCVFCTSREFLGIAHVFVSRAKGGLGVEENGVLLCGACHHEMDNGREAWKQKVIQDYCEGYLEARYQIDKKELKYRKWKGYKYE